MEANALSMIKDHSRPSLIIGLLGVLFFGLNLRPAIISVAFVVPQIRSDFALGATAAGLLTSIPLFAFVLLSAQAPAWGRRFGLARTLMAGLLILALGFAIRLVPNATMLFIGMAIVGAAITIGNVLLPAFIKQRYPDHGGLLMGVYTVSLYAGPALASALTLPIARATGSWRIALLSWGVLVLFAAPLWLPQVISARRPKNRVFQDATPHLPMNRLVRSRLAWAVTAYFAVLSVIFYTVNAWLPTMLIEQGRDADAGGQLLTVVNLVAIPFALVVSILVHRARSQVWATTIGSIGLGLGMAGLYFGPAGAGFAFAALFGIGHGTATGIAFSLAMLRTNSVAGTAALGGMSQTAEYLLSSLGPVSAGALHDVLGDLVSDAWAVVMVVLVAIVLVQLLAGFVAGRDRTLEDELNGNSSSQ